MAQKVKIIFGVFRFGQWSRKTQDEMLSLLETHNVKDLDTAAGYPGNEKALGEAGVPSRFVIHTKAPGFSQGCLKKVSILAGAQKSFDSLGTDNVIYGFSFSARPKLLTRVPRQIETYFLHSPDPSTPIAETMEAIQEIYLAGRFKRFGLSNFSPSEVQEVYEYCSSKNYVLPTVYQGNYNPVARHAESELFPLLRKLKISFYAYSPMAGGFLAKTPASFGPNAGKADPKLEGRWHPDNFLGKMYNNMYARPTLLAALQEWEDISKVSGISKSALAYRWMTFSSALKGRYGDGIILGGNPEQLKETLEALSEGPLQDDMAERIQQIWKTVKAEAPVDNYQASI